MSNLSFHALLPASAGVRIHFPVQALKYILLFLSPFAVYWPYLGNWFLMADNPLILEQAVLYSPWQYFSQPHAYQLLHNGNLTPFLTLAYDLDYNLFGMRPVLFHIHLFLSMGAVIALTYHLLRRLRVESLIAAVAALVFLVAPPMLEIAGDIPTRHYVIGLAFTLLCLIWYRNVLDDQSSRISYTAALVAYALATLSKEVFVPLPLVLFAWTPGSPLRKARKTWPFFGITFVYMAYRFYMLGDFGGYHVFNHQLVESVYTSFTPWEILLTVPFSAFHSTAVAVLILVLSLALLVFAMAKRKVDWWLLACTVVALLIPLSALVMFLAIGYTGSRWFLLVSLAFCVFIAYGLSHIFKGWIKYIAMGMLIAVIPLLLWQVTYPGVKFWTRGWDTLPHRAWKAKSDRFYVYKTSSALDTFGLFQWRYLTYLVKGKPGTFVAANKDILNWLPQPGKSAIRWPFPKSIGHSLQPDAGTLSQTESQQLLRRVTVRDGMLQLTPAEGSKVHYRIYVMDKPFYLFRGYKYSFLYPRLKWDISGMARRAGVELDEARIVIGKLTHGEWKYTPPVHFTRLATDRHGRSGNQ